MAQRSRKRGQRQRPAEPRAAAPLPASARPASARPAPVASGPVRPATVASGPEEPELSRSQRKDAIARASLEPLAPGERPWPLIAGAALAAALGLSNLILFVVGSKPSVSGQQPKLPEILVFSMLMLMCAYGMWRARYWAVLGFQTLLAIGLLGFSLALIKVETVIWALVCVVIIGVCGYLFWKLVRVLGRIQMPTPPQRGR